MWSGCHRRLVSYLAQRNSRSLRSSAYEGAPSKEAIYANESRPPPPPPPDDASASASTSTFPKKKKSSLRFLKYGIYTALLGTSAAVGYATYAYSLEQVDELTKDFRQSVKNHTLHHDYDHQDASSLMKFKTTLYPAAMTVPAKCIDIYLDLRRSIEEQVRGFAEPPSDALLPDLHPTEQNVLTLVLDLNETLIYTDWKRERGWRTFKRPGVDAFLERLAQYYEIVIYSDQPEMYCEPVLLRLDPKQYARHRLSRAATKYQNGKHYRDLSKLNRDPSKVIYVSGHALESSLQPENCAPIKPWKLEDGDTALIDIIPFLEFVARQSYNSQHPADVRQVLASYKGCDIATEFYKRQRQMLEQPKPARHLWPRKE